MGVSINHYHRVKAMRPLSMDQWLIITSLDVTNLISSSHLYQPNNMDVTIFSIGNMARK
jgi:hypothetical protein